MDYIEFNPVEPSVYNEYVPLETRERNKKIVLILLGTLIIIPAIIAGIHLYQINSNSNKKKSKI